MRQFGRWILFNKLKTDCFHGCPWQIRSLITGGKRFLGPQQFYWLPQKYQFSRPLFFQWVPLWRGTKMFHQINSCFKFQPQRPSASSIEASESYICLINMCVSCCFYPPMVSDVCENRGLDIGYIAPILECWSFKRDVAHLEDEAGKISSLTAGFIEPWPWRSGCAKVWYI